MRGYWAIASEKLQLTDEQKATIEQLCQDAAKKLTEATEPADKEKVVSELAQKIHDEVLTGEQREALQAAPSRGGVGEKANAPDKPRKPRPAKKADDEDGNDNNDDGDNGDDDGGDE